MPTLARGAAFVDPAGTVLADPGFLAELGLGPGDATGALQTRAAGEPALAAMLAGHGPDRIPLDGARGGVTLERQGSPAGILLVVRAARDQQHLVGAVGIACLAAVTGGLAHDLRGPLNAMALQLALLGEKLDEPAASAAAGQLRSLREQIGKADDVVRRFVDLLDPPSSGGGVDVGAALAGLAALHAHELRRRRALLDLPAAGAMVLTTATPAPTVRLMLALVGQAVARVPEGGRLELRVVDEGGSVGVSLAQPAVPGDLELAYDLDLAAAAAEALGGSLAWRWGDDRVMVTLRLPGGGRT
jgi:signal transduction histidine kinase